MARTIKGYNAAVKVGKHAAVSYCHNWQRLIKEESIALAQDMATKKIAVATYNKRRKELNEETEKLNDCIKSINKRFS